MSDAVAMPEVRREPHLSGVVVLWAAAVLLSLAMYLLREAWPWLVVYPGDWQIPLREWVSAFMRWLLNDLHFGLFTFREFTRSIAWLLGWPLNAAQGLLANGFRIVMDDEVVTTVPRLSWAAVVVVAAIIGHYAGGWRLSLLVGFCFLYLAVFGRWSSAMMTLSSIVIAVPIGVVLGLAFGIWAFRSARAEAAIRPVLDLMQTVPVFAYLVPILFMFGFGPVAAMIATIIYATPPMVRCSMLALRQVPTEVIEFGRMVGCTKRQLLWKVQIPAARPTLMVGVNQVIMLSLNMVIIASMIGAGGLGFDVLSSLRRLRIGEGIEAGVAITLLAIALDRLSQAFANRSNFQHADPARGFFARHPHLCIALGVIGLTVIVGPMIPALVELPRSMVVTTAPHWDALVSWININFFDELDAFKTFILIHFMIPVRRFMLELPWPAVVGLLALAGYRLGGWRLALFTGVLSLFIAVTGNWEKAMISVYLCGISVIFASAIGIPIGIWAGRNDGVHRVVQVIVDTLQTLPSFVYLIPVVMLFRVGEFSAMIAIVAYAVVPAVRYTDHGIRQVSPQIVEAAVASGCSRRQTLWKVQLPLALPEIMLGINQVIMMALAMLVITALVGTRDLGQEVYIALTSADTGRGIVAGLCVAFIAMIADRLINAWSMRRKQELGLSV